MKRTLSFITLLLGLLAGIFSACTDIRERLDTLETSVSGLKSIAEYLQAAIRDNKIIQEVFQDEESVRLVFTDGSSVTVVHPAGDPVSFEFGPDQVIVTLSDGSRFLIPLYFTVPASITLTSLKPVMLYAGGQASFSFRVNPSNARIRPEDITLEYEGSHFVLAGIEAETEEGGNPIPGHYRATLQDLGEAADYEEEALLVLTATDIRGELLSVSSQPFLVKSFSFQGVNTGLPFVLIETPDGRPITSKTEWMAEASMTILRPDLSVAYEGGLSIKGRGNSTWTQFPKKPYALKLDSKAEILGMAKHKRWCLLANWMDRTLIRNDVAFEISRRTGLGWTPSGRFVELFLNGEHLGNYYICEQIKADPNRVNITELGKKDTEGEAVTGGYIFECDLWYDETFKFMSPLHNVPWQFKDPDEIVQAQFDYIYGYVSAFEASLFETDRFAAREYLDYIDPASFADWWIVNELAQNSEINQPKSAYIHKDRGGKLKAGPVWDFDWGTFIPKDRYNYVAMGQKYYLYQLFQDREFRRLIKERWNACKADLARIPDYIDAVSATLKASDALNQEMWPISRTTNQDESLPYAEAVARMKEAYIGKYNWLDTNIQTF